jgi:hypothetical protein
MKRGQLVKVKAYPDKELLRVVLEEYDTYVLVCRPEVYEDMKNLDIPQDFIMGFPKKDVIEIVEEQAIKV